jgi:hypothetical protein
LIDGPEIGIFWNVAGTLVTDRSTLAQAESYGDCLTHSAGHYERWEEWRALGISGLRRLGFPAIIATSEYDEWPRGRIVYEQPMKQFVLYADRRLQSPATIQALMQIFHLTGQQVLLNADAHYR